MDKDAVLKKRGFIWGPSPEIFGGLAGFYDFGPLGKLVKNNIENIISENLREIGFYEVECPTIMPENVWESSGHLNRFTDPILKCKKCKNISKIGPEKCPKCGGELVDAGNYNLMVKATIGLDKDCFLRPETATTTYLLFPRLYDFSRKKMPISVFQKGKAYRNEISPRQGLIRMREFTQIESQMFVISDDCPEFDGVKKHTVRLLPNSKKKIVEITLDQAIKKKYLKKKCFAFQIFIADKIMKELGFKEYLFRQHKKDERPHYAEDAWDVEVKKDNDFVEVCGIHDRSTYDLSRHEKFSGKKMSVEGKIPNILEIAFGSERLVYTLLYNSLKEDERGNLMQLERGISPMKAAVFPLLKDKKMMNIAFKISKEIGANFDYSGSIGKRYRRHDEIGTPYCITVDHQTIEDNTVTIRERDSMKQKRIKINSLKSFFQKSFN